MRFLKWRDDGELTGENSKIRFRNKYLQVHIHEVNSRTGLAIPFSVSVYLLCQGTTRTIRQPPGVIAVAIDGRSSGGAKINETPNYGQCPGIGNSIQTVGRVRFNITYTKYKNGLKNPYRTTGAMENIFECLSLCSYDPTCEVVAPSASLSGNVEWAEAGPIWRRTKRATIQTTGLPIELGRFHDDKDRIYEKLKKPRSYMGSLFCFPRLEP